MRDGMLLDEVDDNDYHHTFNNTLKAHLLSTYFSITSKKSSALRALHKKKDGCCQSKSVVEIATREDSHKKHTKHLVTLSATF